MAIRVVQQLRHDRYEAILDDHLREYFDVHALAQQESNGSTIVWEITKPRSFDRTVAQNNQHSLRS